LSRLPALCSTPLEPSRARSSSIAPERLAFHHRDPFDRLLVAQSMFERMHIVSCDAQLDPYGITRVWS